MKLDRQQILGMVLLFGIFLIWSLMNTPSREEIAERKRLQDSIEAAQIVLDQQPVRSEEIPESGSTGSSPDSADYSALTGTFGNFAQAATGEEEAYVLENDDVKVTFSNKGGRITSVLLKKYDKILLDESREEYKAPVYLLEDAKNHFDYTLPLQGKQVKSSDLYFNVSRRNGVLEFTATGSDGARFSQKYELASSGYRMDYDLNMQGLNFSEGQPLKLNWVNYLDRIEKNTTYEKFYTSVYFKESEESSPDYCSCRKSDTEDMTGRPLKWVSHANQFFNSSLIADNVFSGGTMSTEMLDDTNDDLKILRSEISIPVSAGQSQEIGMTMYLGPNDFEEMRKFDVALEDVIPFGRSIFGTINRWVVRPLFNLLSSGIVNKGIVILLLTLLVKLALYPLTYKMLHSQAKMSVLKPQLAKLRERHKDDMQKQQLETMKVYREYGVSPLGGCLPMAAQLPIWFALYRFFPASIEFRQAGFLWATDLSSYDVFMNLPYTIPFYGAHVSMFTLLWAGTTVMYTYYNMKFMDMGAMGNQKAFMYMQYLMPVMFLFFFNNYASGLTLYLLFSNLLNIALTVGTKKFIFDDEKIMAELNINKAKPKKKSGFSQRLEQAMKDQQKIAEARKSKK